MPYDLTMPNYTLEGKELAAYPYYEPVYYAQFVYPYQNVATYVSATNRYNLDVHASVKIRYQAAAGIDGGITPGSNGFSSSAVACPDGCHVMLEYEPWSFAESHANFREVDPIHGDWDQTEFAHWEFAYAMNKYKQNAIDHGIKWGNYAFCVIQRRNIQRILNTTPSNSFVPWREVQKRILHLKSFEGREGVADITQSMGGYHYFDAYLSDIFDTSTSNRLRFRRAMRQIAAVLRDEGMIGCPILMPWTTEGYVEAITDPENATRVSESLTLGLIEDFEKDQPGIWSIWAPGDHGGNRSLPEDFIEMIPKG